MNQNSLIPFLSSYNKNNKIEKKVIDLLIEQQKFSAEFSLITTPFKEALEFVHSRKINLENTEEIYWYVKSIKTEKTGGKLRKCIFSRNEAKRHKPTEFSSEEVELHNIPGINFELSENAEEEKPVHKEEVEVVEFKDFYKNLIKPKKLKFDFNFSLYNKIAPGAETVEVKRKDRILPIPDYLFQSLQCNICGLRYKNHKNLSLHLDDHRRKEGSKFLTLILRRSFFTGSIESSSENIILLSSLVIPPEKDVFYRKAGNKKFCFVCGKKIKKVFDDEENEWLFEKGLRISKEKSVHKDCVLH